MSRTKLEKIIAEYDPYRKIPRNGRRGIVDSFFEKILDWSNLDNDYGAA